MLSNHATGARSVASLGFKRLANFLPDGVVAAAKVVYVQVVPKPPLSAIGLNQFPEFESMSADGITFLDTFFAREDMQGNERLHFHELVHVIQWKVLGPKRFVAAYADGLERLGYRA